ncbi:MAG: radical SAM family heme chaperone HemW [Candidatus Riflebacteria bacterium]|nr:radical SAM family heme chaperone HemW [Candidatus Riflebacteria bacterium]
MHIPFCSGKCAYCDFLSAPATESEMEAYVDLLVQEARQYRGRYSALTVFIGGGTPSVLPVHLLARLLEEVVGGLLDVSCPEPEVTVEVNPESFSGACAATLAAGRVNRVSMGVQSFDPAELARLGRRHTVDQALSAWDVARNAGFTNVSLDLIYGFPGHSEPGWATTLDRALRLSPEHLSAYCFLLEEGTRFHEMRCRGQLPEEDEELQSALYDRCRTVLEDRGYRRYEISNFARPGRECRHNMRYWHNDTYLGLGLGAVSFLDGRRRSNARTPEGYRSQVEAGRPWDWIEEPLPAPRRVRESLILGLRLSEGVDPTDLVGGPLPEEEQGQLRSVLSKWEGKGLLKRLGERWALTDRGLFLSNEVFVDLV